jgi:hypothetical protein
VRLDNLDKGVRKRIDMLVLLNDRRKQYEASADWQAMLKLSEEYAECKMMNMAAMIRQEAEAHGAKSKRPHYSTSPDLRGQWGGDRRKKERGVPATKDSVHAGAVATDRRPMPAVDGTRARKKVRTDSNHRV